MNHIWTTQGADLAYRLSAGYELALILVEPMSQRPPVATLRAAVLDIAASPVAVPSANGTLAYSASPIGIPLATAAGLPPIRWLP